MTIPKWTETKESPKAFLSPPTCQEIASLAAGGLPYPEKDLKAVEDVMWDMSWSELAKYADYVTRGSLNTPWFANLHMTDYLTVRPDYSITKVAEIVYVAEYCRNAALKARAEHARGVWYRAYMTKYLPKCVACQPPFTYGQMAHNQIGGCMENDPPSPEIPPHGLKRKSRSCSRDEFSLPLTKRARHFHETSASGSSSSSSSSSIAANNGSSSNGSSDDESGFRETSDSDDSTIEYHNAVYNLRDWDSDDFITEDEDDNAGSSSSVNSNISLKSRSSDMKTDGGEKLEKGQRGGEQKEQNEEEYDPQVVS